MDGFGGKVEGQINSNLFSRYPYVLGSKNRNLWLFKSGFPGNNSASELPDTSAIINGCFVVG